jgi:MYXO-CTERM domain-containing protein
MGKLKPLLLQVGVGLALLVHVQWAAALTQPDNTVIPTGNGLQTLFSARGESINALTDASIVPQTFLPSCKLEFEVLARNAGFQNSFGWYNAGMQGPSTDKMFEFLSCNDGVGTKKLLSIGMDPNYLGKEVGFYQAAGPGCPTAANSQTNFFSQPALNPDGNQMNPFIHLIVYNSTVTKTAFYFAWEDLVAGGDNDFDDLVTFVTGITCSGGGGECQTGKPGVCAKGSLQCQAGKLECLQLTPASMELCDGLDNDCDGQDDETDEGPLCPASQVCDKGSCVPACSGEFPCPPGKVCNAMGYCVDPQCKDKTCPSGTKCVQGVCKAPCDGVTCPYGQSCLVGSCVDPCTKFSCDKEQVCVLGACVDRCACSGCKPTESCQADGICVPSVCENKNCPAGTHCDAAGTCVDNCLGAVCPSAEICQLGVCVPDPNSGHGGAGVGGGFVASVGVGGGSPNASAGSGASAGQGQGGSLGAGGAGGGPADDGQAASCGCRLPGSSSPARPAFAWLLLAAAAVRQRRRERPR